MNDNRAYARALFAEVRANPTAVLTHDRPRLARHEAGHAAAYIACGGTVTHIGSHVAHGTVGHQRGDDGAWCSAVMLWAGAMAAGTMVGAQEDLVKIGDLGRVYLLGRDESSAFAGARFIVQRDAALIDAIAAELLDRGSLDAADVARILGR